MMAAQVSAARLAFAGGTGEIWDADLVERRLHHAYITQARMVGNGDRRMLRGVQVMWPEYIEDKHTAYGAASASYVPPRPSPHDIALLDEVTGWFSRWLEPGKLPPELKFPPDTLKIVWARAGGTPWPKIIRLRARRYGYDPQVKNAHGEPAALKRGRSPIPGGNSVPSLRAIYYAALEYLARKLNEARVPVRGIR